ncbi:MAG: class I SAM-dependent methyltransferase [Nitratireductor sp.]|nr:class I SAM-dependent methyltransferase [Nitratireductor sp.]
MPSLAGGNAGGQPLGVTLDNIRQVTASLPFHASAILKALTHMEVGALTMTLPDGKSYRFDSGRPGPDADITLHNWNPPRRALLNGSIGMAESYVDREWDSSDVTAFLELFSVNYDLGNELTSPSFIQLIIERFRHWMNTNTKRQSRKNIAAHYDLGNAFYALWLDKSMTYSSGIYEQGVNSLEAAQEAKYRSLAERTGISDGDTVLEIGCGWGGFAEFAAKHTGARITGLTISKEQFDFASERIFRAGLSDRVELKLQDYRDETKAYDKIVSIEMFEAVGEKYWPVYFGKVRDCLKSGGKAGLQIITIADKSFDKYRSRPDFIQRYVFPGGMLPSPSILSQLGADQELREEAPRIFPQDYARTLAEWRENFRDAWERIRDLGFDDRFRRVWEFYLHYCEAGFRSENIDVRQVFFAKP